MINMMRTLTQMELIRQDDEKEIIILAHISCVRTFEFNQFECVCYKHMSI